MAYFLHLLHFFFFSLLLFRIILCITRQMAARVASGFRTRKTECYDATSTLREYSREGVFGQKGYQQRSNSDLQFFFFLFLLIPEARCLDGTYHVVHTKQ
ncbi:hypothetical protein HDV57DRAFT_206922 [Trichoderma longibrachiatum]